MHKEPRALLYSTEPKSSFSPKFSLELRTQQQIFLCVINLLAMVNKCSAYGCRSGYSNATTLDTVTFHCYPLLNSVLLEKWKRANPRQDFEPTKYSRICSLHFAAEDFVETTQDKNCTRLKSKSTLQKRYLKADAVPSIFPNAPVYLSSAPQVARSTCAATSSARLENENFHLEELAAEFLANDSIVDSSHQEIHDLLELEDCKPAGFQSTICDGFLCIYMLEVRKVCQVACSICIGLDNCVTVSVKGSMLSLEKVRDLVGSDGKVSSISEILNLMAQVKGLKENLDQTEPEELARRQSAFHLDLAEAHFKRALELQDDRSLAFLMEQLQLARTEKTARSYSKSLLVLCYTMYSTSAAAYGFLRQQEVLCLPSERTLRSITRRMGRDGLDEQSYLGLRASKLSQMERVVVLMIDEIYVANRIEYSSGRVSGVDDDGAVASTFCCFMVKSIAGKYRDMVAMHPVAKLTAEKLSHWYEDTMDLLRSLQFTVIAISVDNAPVNRKFVTNLCGGQLKTSFADRITEQLIFILFDPVHNLKNIYNNFQARKVFRCPVLSPILSHSCEANFTHINELFHIEASKPVKLAHKLNPSVLNPRNIEKSSVKLAVAVFCESTRDALQYYTENEGKPWGDTAEFIGIILKLWKVLNVKTATKGLHKRDIAQDPVHSSLDWKLQFLEEFADFLQAWESSGESGLSRETFLACRTTCRAISACARHLLDRQGFSYVLLGAIQSDSIEGRFGWLRQMSGANYFISARQLIENNGRIAAISLLKFSELSLGDIDKAIDAIASSRDQCTMDVAREMAGQIELSVQPESSDCAIIYYISGALARSFVLRKRGCLSCREQLLCSDSLPPLEAEGWAQSAAAFLDQINRGGLSKPTEAVFEIARHCWQLFEEIRRREELRSKFLRASNQASLFRHLLDELTVDHVFPELFMGYLCTEGHDIKEGIVRSFFNCMMKNLAKSLSVPEVSRSTKRKSAKLSGASSGAGTTN